MPKRTLPHRLKLCAFYGLWLIAVIQFFSSCGQYNYEHIPTEFVHSALYNQINPDIYKKTLPNCTYDAILRSTVTVNPEDISVADFTPKGIFHGAYMPETCNPQFSVAILVTYRNRQKQLDVFLPYMHDFLRKQRIHYKIYLIEQQDEKPWNKGLLYNIGAKLAIDEKFPCLILHDVDLLPLDAANLYACLQQPRHMSASTDKFRYVLTYDWLVGGVLAIRSDQYETLNGFSNKFHGWGGEDDDFADRILSHSMNISRLHRSLSRYTMLLHTPEVPNRERARVMADNRRQDGRRDGLRALAYRALRVTPHRLITWLGVQL